MVFFILIASRARTCINTLEQAEESIVIWNEKLSINLKFVVLSIVASSSFYWAAHAHTSSRYLCVVINPSAM